VKHLRLLLLLFPLQSQAQHTNGCLIYMLGRDTTAIGNYSLEGNRFSMTVADLTASTNVSKLSGTFFPNGELKEAEGYNYNPGKDSQLVSSYTMKYEGDSTFIRIKRNNTVINRNYPVKIMVANYLGGYTLVYMLALLADFAPSKQGDSVVSRHIVFNSARPFTIKRTAARQLVMGSTVMGMFNLLLDDKGQLRSVDGIGTSWNIKGVVVPYVDMDSVIAANVTKDRLHPHAAIVNKLDSVQTTIGKTTIKLRYSRPAVRGREIFGRVVPWDRFWRTGADAATKISIDWPLWFNGKELPAGEYSIFTMPSQKGWTLLFNKDANIWGTEYNPDHDVLRVPMSAERLPSPAELLTIDVYPSGDGDGGAIEISWDTWKATVRFTNKG
jgi:hypothetical protein